VKTPEEIAKLIQDIYQYHGADNGCAYPKALELISDFEKALKEADPSMDKWIEELEVPGGLFYPEEAEYEDSEIYYKNGDDEIVLHSTFTIQELESLINHMKRHKK
jgi:hypothetical protein